MASVRISVYLRCVVCASGLIHLVSGTFSGVSLSNSLGYHNASLGREVRGTVSQNREEIWLYNHPWSQNNKTNAIRMRVECKGAACKQEHPLLFVARQQRAVLSFSLPKENFGYRLASRTLCPILDTGLARGHGQDGFQQFSIDVSSSSPVPVNYTLEADVVKNFELMLNETMSVTVDPAQPVYFLWRYPEGVDTVVVKAESDDARLCVIFSIQGTKCPVYDQARNVEFTGYFQTMTTKAAITMERSDFGSGEFYVVAIVKSSDEECITGERFAQLKKEQPETVQFSKSKGHATRTKTIRITVVPTLSSKDYVKAIALPVAFFGAFYVVAFTILLITWCRQRGSQERSLRSILMPRDSDIQDGPLNAPLRTSSSRISRDHHHYGSTPHVIGDGDSISQHDSLEHEHEPLTTTDGLKDLERNYDMLQDIDQEKDIYRLRTSLMLTDLAKKEKKYLKKKYRLYHWNLLMIAVFYALPVVQLVITYQKVLNSSGDEDICYYNFFCAHPLGYLSAFNNVYSNIGYVMLGFLFFLLVMRRDRLYKQEVSASRELEMHYGIPQHYAIFYAMALALVMEGVLSGCYHVCPNNSNFQFDTSFMYIITCLGIVKLYQTRHPDIAANAHSVYAGFAVLIFIAVIGVVYSSFAFWATFCVIHIFGCLYLSSQLYYMGRVKFDAGMFARVFVLLRYDCCSCPVYKDRMLLLVIANIVNWVFAIYGVVARPNDFATYLLAILIVNGLLYLAFYVIMKLRNKERILLFPLFFLGFTLVCWVAALFFFLSNLTSWQKSPAQSRQGNKECILLGFYDDHDVWHFLSACALFLSFLGLLTLDDDLLRTPRNNIPVF